MTKNSYPLSAVEVKKMASGQWGNILQSLCGLTEQQTTPTRRGMPCPHCNGHDRYEFKSQINGFYMCRGCGAGDGFSMVMKMNHCGFRDALQQIADYLSKADPRPPVMKPHTTQTATGTIERKAQYIYKNAPLAEPNHPYLIDKKLPAECFRQYKGSLVVPVYNRDDTVVNLQFIRPDGTKCFLKGGQVNGCFVWFGGSSSHRVYVCEGVATALSLYLMTGQKHMVVAAFSVANIANIAPWLRKSLPEHRMVLYIDNDAPNKARAWRPGAAALYNHHYFDAVEIPPPGMDASDVYREKVSHGTIV